MDSPPRKRNVLLYNALFAAVCLGLFLFLWNAPQETTARLPNDQDHAIFMQMEKKAAEKQCEKCHSPQSAPLPADHPPKYRCLFCHKRGE